MPSGRSPPPAPRPRSWPSAKAALSSWALPCTPAILTASSSCSAERWVPQRAPTPCLLLQTPFSYLLCSPWPGLGWPHDARLGLAGLGSALPNLRPEVPGAPGARHLPAEPLGAAQAWAGPSRPLSQSGALLLVSRLRGVSGFSSDCRGAARVGSPFLAFPSPALLTFLTAGNWDRSSCRACSELLWKGLKAFSDLHGSLTGESSQPFRVFSSYSHHLGTPRSILQLLALPQPHRKWFLRA